MKLEIRVLQNCLPIADAVLYCRHSLISELAMTDIVSYLQFDSLQQASSSLPQSTSFWVSFPDERNRPQLEISRSCAFFLSSLGRVGHLLMKRRLESPSQCHHGSSRLEQLGVMTATRAIRAYASKRKQ